MNDVETALEMGEIVWALKCANDEVKAARKAGGEKLLAALRRTAEIHLAHADDEDLPDLAKAAAAWRKVAEHDDATADDFEELAWAELLASATKKARASCDEALARKPKRSRDVLQAAVAWATRRKDTKRRDALVLAASKAKDITRLAYATRLLVQAHGCPVALADRLDTKPTSEEPVWDPRHARCVMLRVAAYRTADQPKRADEILAAWVKACEKALPKKDDPRRHVLDFVGSGDRVARLQRRVARVTARLGAKSPALEMPLWALQSDARTAEAHDVAVPALRALDEILKGKGSSQEVLRDRVSVLTSLRDSLLRLRRLDDAFQVVELAESIMKRIPGQLVPDHYGRSRVYEARKDWGRVIEEHVAAVAQYEAAYGKDGSNTELAYAWARQAYERAGRKKEGLRRFPP
jgi:hypothetical protein